jgi:hypothetical protein
MAQSLPSKKISLIDVPEVSNFGASFMYDFFTPDEKVNDTGLDTADFVRSRPAGAFDASFIDSINFKRFTPRYVEFSWKSVVDEKLLKTSQNNPNITNISIKDNFQKIHNEQTFTTDDFTNIYLQDNQKDKKLQFFIRRTLDLIRKGQSKNGQESSLDIVKFLQNRLDSRMDPTFLSRTFSTYLDNGYQFLDKDGQAKVTKSFLDELSQVKVRTQINNKVVYSLLKSTAENTINIFDDELNDQIEAASQIQQQAISQKSSTILDGRDYDFEILDYVGYRHIDPDAFDPTVQIIGYIIDKQELTEKGGLINRESIIVENPKASSTVDLKVRYGTTYVYSIRSIAYMEVAAEDMDSNSIIAIGFLVSSMPSERMVVRTIEEIPPPPPSDFNVGWCYTNQAARLMWNFPVNPQQDIKKFQIFRRPSVDQPFQLIKEYDFDDSVVKTPPREFPNTELVEHLSDPKSFYIDKEFTKTSKFIYAVCAIDAHGFSSGYSIQFEVSFDKFANKIVKRLISLSGAPKAYPNAFLQVDTFVDTIRDSGHSKLQIYFNPEYLNVIDNNNNDMNLIRTDENSEYRLQLINVDIQEQQVIKIKIEDKRPSEKKQQ